MSGKLVEVCSSQLSTVVLKISSFSTSGHLVGRRQGSSFPAVGQGGGVRGVAGGDGGGVRIVLQPHSKTEFLNPIFSLECHRS